MSFSKSVGFICKRISLYEFKASFLTDCSSTTRRISKIFKIFDAYDFPPMHSKNEERILANSIKTSSSSSSIESNFLNDNYVRSFYTC